MKTVRKKAIAWLMVICMLVGFVPVFGSAAALEKKPVERLVLISAKTELQAGTIYSFDELCTYLVDYGPLSYNLSDLQDKIAAKGLDAGDMRSLLHSAIGSAGLDWQNMTAQDILNLPANVMDDIVTFILAGLNALGVDVDPAFNKISGNKLLKWFIDTYVEPVPEVGDVPEMYADSTQPDVVLTCDAPDLVSIDNAEQTVAVAPVVLWSQKVTFTLRLAEPDSDCEPISFEVWIRSSKKTTSEWLREFWQALRAFRFMDAISAFLGLILELFTRIPACCGSIRLPIV